MLPRCSVCLIRHTEAEECAEAGEEPLITAEQLADAFRLGLGVCLPCQIIQDLEDDDDRRGCPACREPWERFADDDLLLGKE